MATVSIPLHSRKYPGLFVLIDEEDYERASQYRWGVQWSGQRESRQKRLYYAHHSRRAPNGETINTFLHRIILDAPPGTLVDHINGLGWDCRRENLRLATRKENARNRGKHANSTAPYKGITWDANKRRWRAAIEVDGQTHYSKRFHLALEAAMAYDRMAIEYFGEFAKANFPQLSLF